MDIFAILGHLFLVYIGYRVMKVVSLLFLRPPPFVPRCGIPIYGSEYTFPDVSSATNCISRKPFPTVFEPPSKSLSVVVPAYNEESRINVMMDETIEYLEKRLDNNKLLYENNKLPPNFSYEIIIVDDGSVDSTARIAFEYTQKLTSDKVRVLRLQRNSGKGYAVRQGALSARGECILMVDADGATKFSDLIRLEDEIRNISVNGYGIAIGSRKHMEATANRSAIRQFISFCFNFYVKIIGGVNFIGDTQCGFKLFTRNAARIVFSNQHLDRWAFDVELLFLAQRAGIPIAEVPVVWNEIPGSKLSIVKAIVNMIRDLAHMRYNYVVGTWNLPAPEDVLRQNDTL